VDDLALGLRSARCARMLPDRMELLLLLLLLYGHGPHPRCTAQSGGTGFGAKEYEQTLSSPIRSAGPGLHRGGPTCPCPAPPIIDDVRAHAAHGEGARSPDQTHRAASANARGPSSKADRARPPPRGGRPHASPSPPSISNAASPSHQAMADSSNGRSGVVAVPAGRRSDSRPAPDDADAVVQGVSCCPVAIRMRKG
jgi:hypothetical protein